MRRLLLVDGNSIMNRAFFAVIGRAPMTAPDGTPTGALNGFFNTLLSVMDEYKPTDICVLFDLKAPTFRHKMSDEYKATRKPMMPELAAQMPICKELLDLMGIARMEMEGYEADDLIGTLSLMGQEAGDTVYILSGDHDDFQLISDNVSVIMPQSGKDKPPRVLYDRSLFEETYGVKPEVFVYVKALMGDNSDNIKGVEKVGEKTAFKLISQYGDIEGVLAHAGEQTPALRSRLEGARDLLELNIKLCTIDRYVPVPFGLEKTSFTEVVDKQGLYDRLSVLALKMLIKKLGLDKMKLSASAVKTNSNAGDEEDSLSNELYAQYEANQDKITITDALPPVSMDDTVGVDFVSVGDKNYAIIGVMDRYEYTVVEADRLQEMLGDTTDIVPVAFDYKSKSKVLDKSLKINSVFDTAIAGYVFNLINGAKPDFARLIESIFKIPFPIEEEAPKQLSLFDMTSEEDDYNTKMNVAARKMYLNLLASKVIKDMIEKRDMKTLLYEIEFPLVVTLDIIERNGMYVSGEKLKALHEEFSERLEEIQQSIYVSTGYEFNISSPKQLADVLFGEDKLNLGEGLKLKKGKTGVYSTSIDELNKIRTFHPCVDMIIEYRALSKLDSTYAIGIRDKIMSDSRVRTTFTQAMTNTGRLSSTEPNLQNIPVRSEDGGRIRECFTAPEGKILVDADYSQIELRLLAAMSKDSVMSDAFINGEDIHKRTAMKVFGVPEDMVTPKQRSAAKTVNFSIIYGISDFGLAQDLDITYGEAKKLKESYGVQFPGITSYLDMLKNNGEKLGYADTMFNRRRILTELSSPNRNIKEFGYRVAMNTPIQGSAADIIKIAMNRVRIALAKEVPDARLVMQVHDELIIECDASDEAKVSELLKREMEGAITLSVPLIADVHSGTNWLEAK